MDQQQDTTGNRNQNQNQNQDQANPSRTYKSAVRKMLPPGLRYKTRDERAPFRYWYLVGGVLGGIIVSI